MGGEREKKKAGVRFSFGRGTWQSVWGTQASWRPLEVVGGERGWVGGRTKSVKIK